MQRLMIEQIASDIVLPLPKYINCHEIVQRAEFINRSN